MLLISPYIKEEFDKINSVENDEYITFFKYMIHRLSNNRLWNRVQSSEDKRSLINEQSRLKDCGFIIWHLSLYCKKNIFIHYFDGAIWHIEIMIPVKKKYWESNRPSCWLKGYILGGNMQLWLFKIPSLHLNKIGWESSRFSGMEEKREGRRAQGRVVVLKCSAHSLDLSSLLGVHFL